MQMPTKRSSELKVVIRFKPLYFAPAVLWGIFILYFSLMPGPDIPRLLVDLNDKLVHAGIYFLSAGLIYLGFIRYNFNNSVPRVSLVVIIAVCIVFGAAIELLQHYLVPNRTGDWLDFLANSAGSIVCVLLFVLFHKAKA